MSYHDGRLVLQKSQVGRVSTRLHNETQSWAKWMLRSCRVWRHISRLLMEPNHTWPSHAPSSSTCWSTPRFCSWRCQRGSSFFPCRTVLEGSWDGLVSSFHRRGGPGTPFIERRRLVQANPHTRSLPCSRSVWNCCGSTSAPWDSPRPFP